MNTVTSLRLDLDLRDGVGRRVFPDAVVLAEDRYLGLGSLPAVDLDPRQELDAAYVAIRKKRPLPLGRYLVLRPGLDRETWVYQAVVHDLDHKPSVRTGDVRRAILSVVHDAGSRGFGTVACEALGVGGDDGLTLDQFAEAVDAAVRELCAGDIRMPRLIILLDDLEQVETLSTLLRSMVLRRASRNLRVVGGESVVAEVRNGGRRLHFRFVPGSLSGYVAHQVGSIDDESSVADKGGADRRPGHQPPANGSGDPESVTPLPE
jgi:hypothetical protein